MNQDKLNEAARSNAAYYWATSQSYNSVEQSFLAGARYVLSLPLSERLTEWEKSKVIEEYEVGGLLQHSNNREDKDAGILVQNILVRLFGKELFR